MGGADAPRGRRAAAGERAARGRAAAPGAGSPSAPARPPAPAGDGAPEALAVASGGPAAGAAARRAPGGQAPGRAASPGPIRQWPEAERPRERLWRQGAAALGDGELLACLLGSGRGGESAVDLGRRLLRLGGGEGVAGLARLGAEELAAVAGIGPAKAAAVVAALELGRRVQAGGTVLPARVTGPEDVARRLLAEMGDLDREQFRVLCLDTKHGLVGSEVIAVGGLDHVPADPREVFKPAVRRSAAAIIVAHNHPSGDPEPSAQDLALTRRLVQAGQVLGVPLLDHLVVARGGFVSLARRGLVPQPD